MQREAEERETSDIRERLGSLRLRGHAAAERLAAGDQRQAGHELGGLGHRGADGRLGQRRRIGPASALLHVRKLIAHCRDAALGERVRDARHEGMRHAGAGAMRDHVAAPRLGRCLQQTGHAPIVIDIDTHGPHVASHDRSPSAATLRRHASARDDGSTFGKNRRSLQLLTLQ
jgi:hypothetical protein